MILQLICADKWQQWEETFFFFKIRSKQQPIAYPHDWPRSDVYPRVNRKYKAFEISHCAVPLHSCIPASKYTVPLYFILASL